MNAIRHNFEGGDGMDNPERKKYQQEYWAAYTKKRKQVKGVLSSEEHARVQARADAAGNTVWQQIRQESESYARGEFLSNKEIRENIAQLYLQLRGIADIIKSTRAEIGATSDTEMLATLRQLEEKIERFTRRPWGNNPNLEQ